MKGQYYTVHAGVKGSDRNDASEVQTGLAVARWYGIAAIGDPCGFPPEKGPPHFGGSATGHQPGPPVLQRSRGRGFGSCRFTCPHVLGATAVGEAASAAERKGRLTVSGPNMSMCPPSSTYNTHSQPLDSTASATLSAFRSG